MNTRANSGDHGDMVIDTAFDFRTDAAGKDPDTYSPTLCRYHQLLWSKPLPSGVVFELVPTSRPPYYYSHTSRTGEFVLSSDAFIPAYTRYGVPPTVLEQFSAEEHDHFNAIGYTIGGLILWTANPIDRKWTINQARGCLRSSIGDRMDLTLESIRRHYRAASSPARGRAGPLSRFLRGLRGLLRLRRLLVAAGHGHGRLLRGQILLAVRRLQTASDSSGPRHLQGVPAAQHRVRRST